MKINAGHIDRSENHRLAYKSLRFSGAEAKPGWLFVGGYRSEMSGIKPSFLWDLAQQTRTNVTLFDYYGCGQSSGDFTEGTIGRWKEDTLAVLDNLTEGPQVVIGSSMGGWLMLLIARERPERMAKMIGIAAAPDFTDELLFAGLSQIEKNILEQEGRVETIRGNDPRLVTKPFLEDGRCHKLLHQKLTYTCPVFLLHGLEDELVPWSYSQRLMEIIEAPFLSLTLVDKGDHRLHKPEELDLLRRLL